MHEDLFAQAELLATVDARKPRQVNLRRAISSAYYAVFHYLVDESCRVLFGTQHASGAYRHVLARAFTHNVMRQACVSFGGGNLKDSVVKGLPRNTSGSYVIHPSVCDIARIFREMQDLRHLADYDRTERFKRSEVLVLIEQAKNSTSKFAALPDSDDRRFFLACLWAWKELVNR